MQAPDRFARFQHLPPELRNLVWEYALPEPRVYEVLDAPQATQKTPAHQGLMLANLHPEPPPSLAAVCRESRYVVLHHYKPLTLGGTTKFVDVSRDILLLEPYLLVKRLHRTLHFLSKIPLVRDRATRLALGTSYGVYPGIFHPVLGRKVSKKNLSKLLSILSRFPRLKTLIFIVHQEFQFEIDASHRPPPPLLPALHPVRHSFLAPGFSPSATTGSSTASSIPLSFLPPQQPPAALTIPTPLPPPPQQQQVFHQAYRPKKSDVESDISRRPRHTNELLYYPLKVGSNGEPDPDADGWDWDRLLLAGAVAAAAEEGDDDGGEWADARPTNDDWARFRRRFWRAVVAACLSAGAGAGAGGGDGRGRCSGSTGKGKEGAGIKLPGFRVKGASLLWRYTRGVGGVR